MAGEIATNNFDVVGKEFANYELFLEGFRDFCRTTDQPFVIATNNQRQVTILCRHGYRRASKSTGQRTNLRYNYLACPAKITCYKPANSTRVRITSVNLAHNHDTSKTAYDCLTVQLSEKECEVVTDLHDANCKVSQICQVLQTKFDKNDNDDGDDVLVNDEPERTLNNREKYNLMLPVMMEIANLASCHGTEQFMGYLTAMKEVAKRVRAGSDIRIRETSRSSSNNSKTEDENTAEAGPSTAAEDPLPCETEPKSKYTNLQLRPKLKSRGRPKRR